MSKEIRWKLAFVGAVAALFMFLAYPPSEQIALGLDLRGGIHLVLQVEVDEAVAAEIRDDAESLRRILEDDENMMVTSARGDGVEGATIVLANPGDRDDAIDVIEEYFPTYSVDTVSDDPAGIRMTLTDAERRRIEDGAVRQANQTIWNRIDEYGVVDPVVQRQGLSGNRILVQLPGIENPERVKNLLRNTALLELALVELPGCGVEMLSHCLPSQVCNFLIGDRPPDLHFKV